MKLSSMLATVVLGSSMFAAAQVAAPQPTANPGPAEPATMTGAFDPAPISTGAQSNQYQLKNEKNDHEQMAPDDPRKSPFEEPRDWNYINTVGGSGA